MWPDCHCSGVGILENCSTLNPLNSPCTVVLLKTLEQSSTKGLSRDVASYHEACFHKGQIRQEIYSMTELSLPKIRVLKYTERAENDLLWHCQDHLTRWKRNSWCATWQEAEWRKKPGKAVIKTRPTLMFHHLKQQLFPLFHSKLQVCSCSIKNSRMWLYWVWNEQMLAKNSRFQVNKLKTGQPQPTPRSLRWPVDIPGKRRAGPACWQSVGDVVWGGVWSSLPALQPGPWGGPRGARKSKGMSHGQAAAWGRQQGGQKCPTDLQLPDTKCGRREREEDSEDRHNDMWERKKKLLHIKGLQIPPINRCIPCPWASHNQI